MKKDKGKWETLRKTFELEVKLVKQALKCSIKNSDYADCLDYNQQLKTMNWVLQEMEAIEKTGEAL